MDYRHRVSFMRHVNMMNSIPIINNEKRIQELISSRIITLDYYNKVKEFYDIADQIYTDHCDLQLIPIAPDDDDIETSNRIAYHFSLIIKFDDLTVTNSRNENINIKDFFFQIILKLGEDGNVVIGHLSGNRTSFTLAEAASRYKFSHLSKIDLSDVPMYTNFCFGDGAIPLIRLQFNQTVPRDVNIFRLFLYNIEMYLQWESLEGGPYIKISDIFNKSSVWNNELISLDSLQHFYNKVFRRIGEIDCDIIIRNNNYMISDNDKFNKSLVEVIRNYFDINQIKKLVLRKGSDNKFYYVTQSLSSINLNDTPIIFKQTEYRYNIVDSDNIIDSEDNYYVNPNFKSYVKSAIEYKLNQEIIKSNFIKQLQDQVEI